jgi:hypothetical protein
MGGFRIYTCDSVSGPVTCFCEHGNEPYRNVDKDLSLLGCYTVSTGNYLPDYTAFTFKKFCTFKLRIPQNAGGQV